MMAHNGSSSSRYIGINGGNWVRKAVTVEMENKMTIIMINSTLCPRFLMLSV